MEGRAVRDGGDKGGAIACLIGDDCIDCFSGDVYSAAMAASRCGRIMASSALSDSSSALIASSGDNSALGFGLKAFGVGEAGSMFPVPLNEEDGSRCYSFVSIGANGIGGLGHTLAIRSSSSAIRFICESCLSDKLAI